MVDRARAELLDELEAVLLLDGLKVCRAEELDVDFVRDVIVGAIGAGAGRGTRDLRRARQARDEEGRDDGEQAELAEKLAGHFEETP